MGLRENVYQHDVIQKIQNMLPGAIILKNDPQYIQGIPDLTVLYGKGYAMLEVKRNPQAKLQPNQEYYLRHVRAMGGFAEFICPENEMQVLDALQRSFEPER